MLTGSRRDRTGRVERPRGRPGAGSAARCRALVAGALGLAGVVPAATAGAIGPVTAITITANAVGPDTENCADFVLTPVQVRAFFDRAVLITAGQQHDFFLYGACLAQGSLKTRYDSWTWEIRSLGTATLRASSGDVFLLGDPAQTSSLDDDGR